MSTQELLDYAANKRSNLTQTVAINYGGVDYTIGDIISSDSIALYAMASGENAAGNRAVRMPNGASVWFTNSEYIALIKNAANLLQQINDIHNEIIAQINGLTLLDEGDIDTAWTTLTLDYTTNRVAQPTLEAIAASALDTRTWHSSGNPVSGTRAIVTANNAANGFKLSDTAISNARYNVTLTISPTLLASASVSVAAYVAPTKSTNPADWVKYDQVSLSLPAGVDLSGVQAIQTLVIDAVPAGYWIRLLGTVINGTAAINSFREKY